MSRIVANTLMWLTNSGVQNESPPCKGAFNSYHDGANWAYAYSEITGYALTFLMWIRKRFPEYRDVAVWRARLAAEWLLNEAMAPGRQIFLTRCYYNCEKPASDFRRGAVYAFDNGMIAHGLLSLFETTQDERYLDAAIGTLKWLISDAQRDDGFFEAVYNSCDRRFLPPTGQWSRRPGSYHVKIALGLLHNSLNSTDLSAARQSAIRVCAAALQCQRPDGRFTTDGSGVTSLHPHLYAAEGLLISGLKTNNAEFVRSADRAVSWCLLQMHNDGSLPANTNGTEAERVDVVAQTLRLTLLLLDAGELQPSAGLLAKLEVLAQHLRSFQIGDSGQHRGAFAYGHSPLDHPNSWVTMFATQAVALYEDWKQGQDLADYRTLFV